MVGTRWESTWEYAGNTGIRPGFPGRGDDVRGRGYGVPILWTREPRRGEVQSRPGPPQTQGSESYLRAGAPIDRLDASKLYPATSPVALGGAAPET